VLIVIAVAPAVEASERLFEVAGWYVFLEPTADGTVSAGDPAEPLELSLTQDSGYGASAIIFFGRRLSTEIGVSYVKTGIDLERADEDDPRLPRRQSTIIPLTATLQYHMRPDAMIDPYIGVGAMMAYFGEVDPIEDDDPSVDEIDATGIGAVVNLGMNVELMEQMGLLFDIKWSPSNLTGRGLLNNDPATPFDVNIKPLTVSLGVSWRF
jgi:outer membrane protein W